MRTHEKEIFLQTYDWANDWRDLPWAHDEPTPFLAEVCRHKVAGKALDIGCDADTRVRLRATGQYLYFKR